MTGMRSLAYHQAFQGVRRFSSQAQARCLYSILEVPPSATKEEIKAAFRRKAKAVHPDAEALRNSGRPTGGQTEEWVQVLRAYETLSNARSRELYDVSVAQGSSRFLRNAAADGVQKGGGDDTESIDLSWGLESMLSRKSSKESNSAVDKIRDELQSDFYAALRSAYLGPELTDLQRGQLPDSFEADERSTFDTADVLQLVSGRMLLGCVRERRPEALPTAPETGHQLLQHDAGNSTNFEQDDGENDERRTAVQDPFSLAQDEEERKKEEDINGKVIIEAEDMVLDLVVDDEILATAVRHVLASDYHQKEKDRKTEATDKDSVHRLHRASFFKNGALVARLVEDLDNKTSNLPSSNKEIARITKLLNSEGKHTHTIVRTTTPLVRHLSFLDSRGKISVARAHRAWLPPSSLWLFKPRSYDHDVGGWSISWAGYAQVSHPAWLDPSLVVLVAACHTIDHEVAARQPQGVYMRAREGDETAGGAFAWLRAMMRFHRKDR